MRSPISVCVTNPAIHDRPGKNRPSALGLKRIHMSFACCRIDNMISYVEGCKKILLVSCSTAFVIPASKKIDLIR